MYKHFTGFTGQSDCIEGIDISHHQGTIDWGQLTPDSSHKQFIIAKATEGATYQDPMFIEYAKHAWAAGFRQVGTYHFLRFGSSLPKDQMKNFISQIEALKAALPDLREPIIALDIEEHKGADYTLVQSVTEESVRCLKAINITPFIYTRTSFWDAHVSETPAIVKACPLWIARWRTTPPEPKELPKGWDSWKIWQYTDQGKVPGISGSVDLNRMKMV